MRILVTGSEGFIGGNLMRFLKEKGHEPFGFDIKNSSAHQDVRSKKNILEHMLKNDIEAVSHQAALPRVMYSIKNPLKVNNTNLGGTLNLLDACLEMNVENIVFASSCSVYGNREDKLKENMSTDPVSPYASSKVAAEAYIRSFQECYGMKASSLRYSNVYGDGMDPHGAYALVIGKWLELHKQGKALPIYGDGHQTRDFVHVDDVCQANLAALQKGKTGRFNIGSGKSTEILSIVKWFGDECEFRSSRTGEIYKTSIDIKKACKYLDYKTQKDLKQYILESKG